MTTTVAASFGLGDLVRVRGYSGDLDGVFLVRGEHPKKAGHYHLAGSRSDYTADELILVSRAHYASPDAATIALTPERIAALERACICIGRTADMVLSPELRAAIDREHAIVEAMLGEARQQIIT